MNSDDQATPFFLFDERTRLHRLRLWIVRSQLHSQGRSDIVVARGEGEKYRKDVGQSPEWSRFSLQDVRRRR